MGSKRKNQKIMTAEIAEPSLSKAKKKPKIDLQEAMKKQNDVDLFLARKVISVNPKTLTSSSLLHLSKPYSPWPLLPLTMKH